MVKFVCNNCGYRFDSDNKNKNKCPYCSKGSVEKEKNASEILEELSMKRNPKYVD